MDTQAQLEEENKRLRAQLEEARTFVRLVAEDYWVAGERYEVCFFCDSAVDDHHRDDCPVLLAKRLLSDH